MPGTLNIRNFHEADTYLTQWFSERAEWLYQDVVRAYDSPEDVTLSHLMGLAYNYCESPSGIKLVAELVAQRIIEESR